MKTIVVTVATGEYRTGAEVLHRSIRKQSNTAGVEFLILDDADIAKDYSNIPVNMQWFPQVAKKFFALTLDADRIVILDADMLCVRDCSYLWSWSFGRLPFYACRDTASITYYPQRIADIGLDRNLIFTGGTMIYNRCVLPGLHEKVVSAILSGCCQSYDGGDQGYLNHYMQSSGIEVGYLPSGYNYVLDAHMPRLPDYEQYLIHFTGKNANPWNKSRSDDWRKPYFDAWDKAASETE